MRRVRVSSSWLVVVASLLMLLAVSGSALAQSGRRTQKPPSPPVPVQPEPTPTPVAKPALPQINVLVISDISQSTYLSIPFPERAHTWVVKRLRDSSLLTVMEGERASRSEAVKKAKASKDTFIVFVRVDETAPPRPGNSDRNDVAISYYVYAPVTGKSQSSGVVYVNQRGTLTGLGRIRTAPVCYPGVRGSNDLLLLDASLEVAGRIFSALSVPTPPLCA